MIEMTFRAERPADLPLMMLDYLAGLKGIALQGQNSGEIKEQVPPTDTEEIKPVLTQEQMEENVKNAPVHEDPPQPTLEEVRAALKALRDRKGAPAVKALLKEYGADSVPELKPEDYLVVRDRAVAEV